MMRNCNLRYILFLVISIAILGVSSASTISSTTTSFPMFGLNQRQQKQQQQKLKQNPIQYQFRGGAEQVKSTSARTRRTAWGVFKGRNEESELGHSRTGTAPLNPCGKSEILHECMVNCGYVMVGRF